MARQGHRVWSTRLKVLAICLLVLAVAGKLGWDSFTRESTATKPADTPVGPHDPKQPAHALDPLLQFARESLIKHCKEHRDYTATLIKRERVGKTLQPESKLALKLKYRPDSIELQAIPTEGMQNEPKRQVSVYLRTIEPKSQAGREVIWIEGQNDNKLKAHEAGVLGLMTVELAPTSRLAMVGNRYPITDIGLEKLLRKLIERGERDRLLGPATVRTRDKVEFANRTCKLLEIIHEQPTVKLDDREVEFEFHLAQIYIDESIQLPIRYASYAWPKQKDGEPELLEEYTYEDLKLNVGLTEADFDAKNPNYGF